MYKIDVLPALVIGRQDDSMVEEVSIDCSAWADTNPALTSFRVEMSIGGVKFAPLRQSYAGGVLKWEISQQDTAVAGEGRYEIVATGDGGYHKTSASATVYVNRRIPGRALAVPPDYVQPLLDRIAEMLAGSGGSNVTPEQIRQVVEEYMAENPAVDEAARQGVEQLSEELSSKLDASELPTAVNGALAQAKASGDFKGDPGEAGKDGYTPVKGVDYFDGKDGQDGIPGKDGSPGADGKDGTSVTVKSVSESSADGGSNIVTFSDGKTLTVKNGSKGSTGEDGYTPVKGVDYFDGAPGADGKDGTSATHSWNGTVLTVTSASGTSSADLKGQKGDTGETGSDGRTPVKGTDYFTAADKAEMVEQVKRSSNPLNGKKVSFLGDSICAGGTENTSYLGGYGKIIADRNGMVYENVAHGGATVTAETYSSSTGNAKPWLCRMVASMSADADYAIIEGGLNDGWEENLPIGQMSTGYNAVLDDTTYYGAFESMLKQLVTRFQGKKIGYIAVPKIHSLYDSEQNVPNFYHIAMECCAKWGVPVCDLNTISPPVEYLKTFGTTYTADGTHPTYEGYLKYYCDPIEEWMKTLTTGGNGAAGMVLKAVNTATSGINASIAALQTGKLNNTGVSFRRAILNLADGTKLEIDVLTAVDGTAVIPFVNRMPISIDSDGTVYNSVGWKGSTRLSASSGSVKENTELASIIGFIPVKKGDVVRFKFGASSTCWDGNNINSGWNIIAYYNSSFVWLGSACPLQSGGQYYGICNAENSLVVGSVKSGEPVSFTVPANDNIAYLRISFSDSNEEGLANLIVTVNQEITD